MSSLRDICSRYLLFDGERIVPSRGRPHARVSRLFWPVTILAALAVIALTVLASTILNSITLVSEATYSGARSVVIFTCLTLTACIGYIGWLSRYNIVAHAQLAFSVVAYGVPILVVGSLGDANPEVLSTYELWLFVGTLSAVFGGILGRVVWRSRAAAPAISSIVEEGLAAGLQSRIARVIVVAILGLLLAFLLMGFIPALADDPYAAKFFRGAYAAAYAPVAPLYRAATGTLILMIPLAGLFALKTHKLGWAVLFVSSIVLMLLSLQRGPALSGILVLVGSFFVSKRRGMGLYFLILVASYLIGSAAYQLLAVLGLDAFATSSSQDTFIGQVAAGAPDVADQLQFLEAWLRAPQFTNGLTFIGGLVPGNFQWNPAVWSLQVVSPGADVSTVVSGGLRLPPQLWGFVSFGWGSLVGVSFFYGLINSLLAHWAGRAIQGANFERITVVFVLYGAAISVFGEFYFLTYLATLQLGLIVVLLGWHRKGTGSLRPIRDVTGHFVRR